jgi:glyoxylase I family protein
MQLQGIAHVAVTVTDLERSKEWYGRVFGWEALMEGEGDGVRFSVGAVPGAPLLGLRQYDATAGKDFDPTRIGLDHLAFDGGTADGLREWEQRFDELGLDYTPVQETPYGHVLNFKDPDGIALEIYAAPQQG